MRNPQGSLKQPLLVSKRSKYLDRSYGNQNKNYLIHSLITMR